MAAHPPPPMDQYRRIQIARFLIDKGLCRIDRFAYGEGDGVVSYGLPAEALDPIIDSGEPFRTSGCEGYDGQATAFVEKREPLFRGE